MQAWGAIVLAAGRGTRMKSDRAKVLHEILGRPMVACVLDALELAGIEEIVVVVGHQADEVRRKLAGRGLRFALQEPQLGTGHAVMQAEPILAHWNGSLLVLNGDTPLLTSETIEEFIHHHQGQGVTATVLSAELDDPDGYGRVVRFADGSLDRIVEEKDADDAIRSIKEINSGLFSFRSSDLFEALKSLDNDNAQREYYLPDVLRVLRESGRKVGVYMVANADEIHGVNTLEDLERAEVILRARVD